MCFYMYIQKFIFNSVFETVSKHSQNYEMYFLTFLLYYLFPLCDGNLYIHKIPTKEDITVETWLINLCLQK